MRNVAQENETITEEGGDRQVSDKARIPRPPGLMAEQKVSLIISSQTLGIFC
jgi:hypothetical protein